MTNENTHENPYENMPDPLDIRAEDIAGILKKLLGLHNGATPDKGIADEINNALSKGRVMIDTNSSDIQKARELDAIDKAIIVMGTIAEVCNTQNKLFWELKSKGYNERDLISDDIMTQLKIHMSDTIMNSLRFLWKSPINMMSDSAALARTIRDTLMDLGMLGDEDGD